MTEPRRLTVEVSGGPVLDWPDVADVIAFAEGWLERHAPGIWKLADVARFDQGDGVRWEVAFLESGAPSDPGDHDDQRRRGHDDQEVALG